MRHIYRIFINSFHYNNGDYLKKLKPKIIGYRNYKSFSNESFREELEQVVSNEDNCDANFRKFISTGNRIDQYVPKKKRYIRGNQSDFEMNEVLSMTIMLDLNLEIHFFKTELRKIKIIIKQ